MNVRRTIGMVFQRPNPFPTMSIAENVLAGVRLTGQRLSKSDAEAIVEESLRGANLWEEVKDRLNRPGSGLSGGQQQRLCIARAIAVKPKVLLMDEPCSALDPISTLAIEDLIRELVEQYTIVIVTHNMQQAGRVSDTTAFFNLAGVGQPGRLVESGATRDIFSDPEKQATEDYISGRFGWTSCRRHLCAGGTSCCSTATIRAVTSSRRFSHVRWKTKKLPGATWCSRAGPPPAARRAVSWSGITGRCEQITLAHGWPKISTVRAVPRSGALANVSSANVGSRRISRPSTPASGRSVARQRSESEACKWLMP